MTNFQTSDLNLINAWLQPGADADHTSMSCFQQLRVAQPPQPKPLKRLDAFTLQYTGLAAGVKEIQSFARKGHS
jgi:streptomycin 6-kinase